MATKMFEVQQKLFSALESSEGLKEKSNGIYDYVPEKTQTPYITFGETISDSRDTKTTDGETIRSTIDVWSESRGRKQAVDIIIEIEKALEKEISIETGEIIIQRIVQRSVDEVQYGLYQGTIEIEIVLSWS